MLPLNEDFILPPDCLCLPAARDPISTSELPRLQTNAESLKRDGPKAPFAAQTYCSRLLLFLSRSLAAWLARSCASCRSTWSRWSASFIRLLASFVSRSAVLRACLTWAAERPKPCNVWPMLLPLCKPERIAAVVMPGCWAPRLSASTLAATKLPRLSLGFAVRARANAPTSASGVVFNFAARPRKLLTLAEYCRSAFELSRADAARTRWVDSCDWAAAVADAASRASVVTTVPAYHMSRVSFM